MKNQIQPQDILDRIEKTIDEKQEIFEDRIAIKSKNSSDALEEIIRLPRKAFGEEDGRHKRP